MRLYGWADLLKYKIAPKYTLSGPFHHSGVGRNPAVAGRFVAMISFLHTPVSLSAPQPGNIGVNWEELKLVNRIRQGTTDWQHAGYPGVTSTTRDLINHWTDREEFPLYFAQIDAVLIHIYLRETSPTDIPQDFQRINLKYTTA